MYVEVRKRLGIANVYIPSSCEENTSNQLNVRLKNNVGKLELSKNVFEWPDNIEKVGVPSECTYQSISDVELLFRIALEPSRSNSNVLGVSLLLQNTHIHRSNKSTHKIVPACFPDNFNVNDSIVKTNGEVKYQSTLINAFCLKCDNKLFNMECSRVLPLPSFHWKENSMDWFCACSHTSSKRQKIEKSDETTHKVLDHKCESGGNRSLSGANLSPRLGDILYTSVFTCISTESLKDEEVGLIQTTAKILNCTHCNAELGFNDVTINGRTLTLWDHSVLFTTDEVLKYQSKNKTPLTSIKKICEVATDECAKPFILIVLKELGGENRHLNVRLLEKNLSLIIADDNAEGNKLQVRDVMKVMYCLSSQENRLSENSDWETYVGTDMIEATFNSLSKNSFMIPGSQRYHKAQNDQDFTFSYIFN